MKEFDGGKGKKEWKTKLNRVHIEINVWCLWKRDSLKKIKKKRKKKENEKKTLHTQIVMVWIINGTSQRHVSFEIMHFIWSKIDSSEFMVRTVWLTIYWSTYTYTVLVHVSFEWVDMIVYNSIHINVYVIESMENQFHCFTCNQMKSTLLFLL